MGSGQCNKEAGKIQEPEINHLTQGVCRLVFRVKKEKEKKVIEILKKIRVNAAVNCSSESP